MAGATLGTPQPQGPGMANGTPMMSQQQQVDMTMLPARMNGFPLANLIENAVQRVYSNLAIMKEILVKKPDVERKLAIVQFALATRQLFVRLLAVVKWAKNSDKVETCSAICNLLNEQSIMFERTADALYRLKQETLLGAKLPTFQIPAAVDVLTLGIYPRLPACLKKNFVSESSLSPAERTATLRRLKQVILNRLVSTVLPLPSRVKRVEVENGMLLVHVPGEFEARLTLLGELQTTPWTLLDLRVFVDDRRGVGLGRDLLHPFQLDYVHQLVQARLYESTKPLDELYSILHTLCVSLQLEVLLAQVTKILQARHLKPQHMDVDDYQSGKRLVVSYWRQVSKKQPEQHVSRSLTKVPALKLPPHAFKLTIQSCANEPFEPLETIHEPSCSHAMPRLDPTNPRLLDVETLLMRTLLSRSRQRLAMLRDYVCDDIIERITVDKSAVQVESADDTSVSQLIVPLLSVKSKREESLLVLVHAFSGRFICQVPVLDQVRAAKLILRRLSLEVEECETKAVTNSLRKLRALILLHRVRSAALGLPVTVLTMNQVPWSPGRNVVHLKLSSDAVFLRFDRYSSHYVVVDFVPSDPSQPDSPLRTAYFLIRSQSESSAQLFSSQPLQASNSATTDALMKSRYVNDLIKPISMSRFDAAALQSYSTTTSPCKPAAVQCLSLPALPLVVSVAEQRIPYILLTDELNKRGVMSHIERSTSVLALRIIGFNNAPSTCPAAAFSLFWRRVVSCYFRIAQERQMVWHIELVVHQQPLSDVEFQSVLVRPFQFSPELIERVVDEWMGQLESFARMWHLGYELEPHIEVLKERDVTVSLRSLSAMVFTYAQNYTLKVTWTPARPPNTEPRFALFFGANQQSLRNPHGILFGRSQFATGTTLFSINPNDPVADILDLLNVLPQTLTPCAALCSLSRFARPSGDLVPPVAGPQAPPNKPHEHCNMQCDFLVNSLRDVVSFRVVYGGVYCLEVVCLSSKQIALRDVGATQACGDDTGQRTKTPFLPIYGLTAFVNIVISSDDVDFTSNAPQSVAAPDVGPHISQATAASSIAQPHSVPAGNNPVGSPFHPPASVPPNAIMGFSQPPTPASPSKASPAKQFQPAVASPMVLGPGSVMSPLAGSVASPGMHQPPGSILSQPSPAVSFPATPRQQQPLSVGPFSVGPQSVGPAPQSVGEFNQSWGQIDTSGAGTPQSQRTAPPAPSHNQGIAEFACTALPIPVSHEQFNRLSAALPRYLGSIHLMHKLMVILDPHGYQQLQQQAPPVTSPLMYQGSLSADADPQAQAALRYRLAVDQQTMQTVRLNLENQTDSPESWEPTELRLLEYYFTSRVVASQLYSRNAVRSFLSLIRFTHVSGRQRGVLRASFLPIIRQEMSNQISESAQWTPSLLWVTPSPSICLVPGPPQSHPGAVSVCKSQTQTVKVLFWICFTRLTGNRTQVAIPFVYDMSQNNLTLFTNQQNQALNSPRFNTVNSILHTVNQTCASQEYLIWSAVQEIMRSLQ